MDVAALHSWDLTPKEAARLQSELAGRVVTDRPLPSAPRLLAGCDISTARHSTTGYAGVVLLDARSLDTVAEFTLQGKLRFPYVPGLLSFREGPLLLELFRQVHPVPDLIFFDGQGLAHPRRLGLACHLGLWLNRPTVGLAKSRLIGEYREPADRRGAHTPLKSPEGEVLGAVLRTREHCKPIFVSAGHRIDLDSALEWTLQATTRYRLPEPTRRAHLLVNALRRGRS